MKIRDIRSLFSKLDVAVLVGGLVSYIGFCALLIQRSSIWFDEAFGAYLIRFNFAELTYYTGKDVHPPLYYYFLKLWSLLFGTSDLALRSMSVFFGVVVIVIAFTMLLKIFGRKAAYLALGLLVLSPMFIRYSVEMRMYTLVMAIVLVATFVLLRVNKTNSWKLWIIYAVLVAAGMLTHYLVALAWLSHWVWRIAATRDKSWHRWRKQFFSKQWLLAHVLAITIFAPWLPWFYDRFKDVQDNGFWIPPVTPVTIIDYITNFFVYQNATLVSTVLTVLLLAVGFFIAASIKITSDSFARPHRLPYLMIASVAFVPLILLILLSIPPLQSIFIDRYAVYAIVCGTLFLAILISQMFELQRRFASIGLILITATSMIGIYNVSYYGNFNKFENQSNQTKDLIEKVRSSSAPSQPIIADSPWLYYEAAHYSSSASSVYFIDKYTEYKYGALEMLKQNDIGKIKDLDEFLQKNGSVWYIGRPEGNQLNPPAGDMQRVQSIFINDEITGKPAYEATLFQLNEE